MRIFSDAWQNTDENEKSDNADNADNSLSLTPPALSAPPAAPAAPAACLVTASAACLVTASAADAAPSALSAACLVAAPAAAAVTPASSLYLLSEILMTSPGLNIFCDEKNFKHHIDPASLPEKTSTRILKFTDIDKDKDMQVTENDEKEQKMMQKIYKELSYH
ncbi:hypothetical protein BDDG_11789 [Blastomyces dermatitidis ATCC 18188]|uniref:Uncharacterized protein n=1 Tax=Ajellomyces dermatitidis (strain ATCC 18188 / CBS 674.68) TaxID=653446 RepID=A0A0J9HCX7_AJEDA|nr:hypothetical protein BDDG_11789 [Blastomyces dermatitidis ATCC 18188]